MVFLEQGRGLTVGNPRVTRVSARKRDKGLIVGDLSADIAS